MATTFKTKISNLPIICLAIIFSLSALLITSCGGNGNDKPAAAKVDSTKASFKILGTWVSIDDPANKVVFTTDSLTTIEGSKGSETNHYKWVSEQEIEITTDKKQKAKITIDGDKLTMIIDGEDYKLIREGATPADNDPVNTNLTPEQKVFKNKLTGTWVESRNYRRVFTNDGRVIFYLYGDTVNIEAQYYYRIIGDSTVEWLNQSFEKYTYSMSFSPDKKVMTWVSQRGKFPFAYLSENADVDFSNAIGNNIRGNWLGIAGTAAANERLSIIKNQWSISVNDENFNTLYYAVTPEGNVTMGGKSIKVSVENDVLTTDENGVIKKYNRHKPLSD